MLTASPAVFGATWLAVAHRFRSRIPVVVLDVATSIAAAAAVGMATAGGVGVPSTISVSVIGIAVLLERYHDKLDTMMIRMSDAMADWE